MTKSTKNSTELEDDDPNTMCGIGSWHPKWLQMFAKPYVFLFNMTLVGVIQSMPGTMMFGVIGTLEKRYGFDSKVSSIIMISDNFANLLVCRF